MKTFLLSQKHCVNMRNCLFWAISSFGTLFSKVVCCRGVRVCLRGSRLKRRPTCLPRCFQCRLLRILCIWEKANHLPDMISLKALWSIKFKIMKRCNFSFSNIVFKTYLLQLSLLKETIGSLYRIILLDCHLWLLSLSHI